MESIQVRKSNLGVYILSSDNPKGFLETKTIKHELSITIKNFTLEKYSIASLDASIWFM